MQWASCALIVRNRIQKAWIGKKYANIHISNVTEMVDKRRFFGHNIGVELLTAFKLSTRVSSLQEVIIGE